MQPFIEKTVLRLQMGVHLPVNKKKKIVLHSPVLCLELASADIERLFADKTAFHEQLTSGLRNS